MLSDPKLEKPSILSPLRDYTRLAQDASAHNNGVLTQRGGARPNLAQTMDLDRHVKSARSNSPPPFAHSRAESPTH